MSSPYPALWAAIGREPGDDLREQLRDVAGRARQEQDARLAGEIRDLRCAVENLTVKITALVHRQDIQEAGYRSVARQLDLAARTRRLSTALGWGLVVLGIAGILQVADHRLAAREAAQPPPESTLPGGAP